MPVARGFTEKRHLACQVFLVLALAAAASTTSAAAAPTRHSDLGGDFVAFVNSLSHIAAQDRSNCTKMAADLKSYVNSHHAALASLEARARHLTKAQKVAFGREYAVRLATALRVLTQNVLACAANAQVRAALAALQGIKTGP